MAPGVNFKKGACFLLNGLEVNPCARSAHDSTGVNTATLHIFRGKFIWSCARAFYLSQFISFMNRIEKRIVLCFMVQSFDKANLFIRYGEFPRSKHFILSLLVCPKISPDCCWNETSVKIDISTRSMLSHVTIFHWFHLAVLVDFAGFTC